MPDSKFNNDSNNFLPPVTDSRMIAKLAALTEVAAVIGASMIVVMLAQTLISPGLVETLGFATGEAPDFIASSFALIKQFGLQYGTVFGLVIIFGILRRRKKLKSYALVKGTYSLRRLLGIGVVAGFIASLPIQTLMVAREIWPLGQPSFFWIIADMAQWDWTFWIFMGVGSFLLVPVIEELTWRGYILGRLVENFTPGAALIVTTLFFSFLHIQYLINLDILNIGTLAGLIFAAFVFGLITLHTGSLIPVLIAHLIINFPVNFDVGVIKILVSLGLIIYFRKAVNSYGRLLWVWVTQRDSLVAIILLVPFAGLAYASLKYPNGLQILVGGLGIAALGLGYKIKSTWHEQKA